MRKFILALSIVVFVAVATLAFAADTDVDLDSNSAVDVAYGGTNAVNAANARTNLGLAIGTNVQAYDAELAALAGLTSAANAIPYFTGSGTAGTVSSSANMVSLLGSADYATARTNLGLAIGTNVQAYDAELAALAGLTSAANAIPYFTGAGTAGTVSSSANMVSLLGSADYATARTNLGLAIGTNVQAYDADLTTYAGITPSANIQSLLGSADYATARTNLGLAIGTNVQAYAADLANIVSGWAVDASGNVSGIGTLSAGAAGFTVGADGAVTAKSYSTAASATPYLILDDSDGADGKISVNANDADDSVMDLAVDESDGDDEAYLQLDGVNETVEVFRPFVVSNEATTAGIVRILEDTDNGSNYSELTVGTQAANISYVLPTAAGSANQVMGIASVVDTTVTLEWQNDDSAGATALDDIGDPDAATTIAFADGETVSMEGASDNEVFWNLQSSDADLADLTYLLQLYYQGATYDTTSVDAANAVYLIMKDYTTTAYSFSGAQFSSYRPIVNYEGNAGSIASEVVNSFTASQTLAVMDEATDYVRGFYCALTNTGINHTAGNLHAFEAYNDALDVNLTAIAFKVTGAGFWDYDFSGQNGETIDNATDTQIRFLGDESLILDLDTATDNEVGVSSGSSATRLNFGTLNLITSGTILGAVNIVVTTDGTEEPTAEQMYGTMFIADHGTATSDTDYTLPTAVAGMSACFYDNGGGTGGIIIDASAADEILLDGTGVGVADAIDSPGVAGDGANGDFICLLAIDATYWITLGRSGTWVDGGAD